MKFCGNNKGWIQILNSRIVVAIIALVVALGATGLHVSVAQEGTPPRVWQNGGFEGSFADFKSGSQISGQIAPGWSDNSSWADVSVDYSADSVQPHSGRSAQKIAVKSVRSGAVQFVQNVDLREGQVYRASVWLRCPEPVTVELKLQNCNAPYNSLATKMIQLTSNWQRSELTFRSAQSCEAFYMLRLTSPVSLWVDDASFEDISGLPSSAPAYKGNMLPNASFETGLSGGWDARVSGAQDLAAAARAEILDPHPTSDSDAAVGSKSMKIEIPARMQVQISSPLVPFHWNRTHSASIVLKASRPAQVQVELENTGLRQSFEVGTTWKRYALEGVLFYAPHTRLWVRATTDDKPLSLWFDGAMLEEKAQPSPNYQAAFPVELSLDTSRPGAIFFDGEAAKIGVRTSSNPPGARLKLQLQMLGGTTRQLPPIALPTSFFNLAPDSRKPRGLFKIKAQVVDAKNQAISAPVEQVFARLPRPKKFTETQIEASFFGSHFPLTREYLAIANATGTRWARVHDATMFTKWAVVEPNRDEWNWVDDGVDLARKSGVHVLGMLDGAPAWASSSPRATSGYFAQYNQPNGPDAMERWKNYASLTATHFKGRIDNWEIWNEPWGSNFFSGPPEEYAALLRAASTEVHAANSKARVLGICAIALHDMDWAARAIKAAPPSHYDIFSYHDYNSNLYGGPDSPVAASSRQFRKLLNDSGGNPPLWNSEGGPEGVSSWYAPGDGLKPEDQPAYIVRFDVTQMGAGIQKFFLYTMHGDSPQGASGFCVLEFDRAPKPILAARAVLANLVDGAGKPQRREPQAGIDDYIFPNGVHVLWSYHGGIHPLSVPKGMNALDVWGNDLGRKEVKVGLEPVYFVPVKS